MNKREVLFPGSSGELLAGRLELPAGPVVATALFAHCFTCGKDSVAASRISRELAARGVAVLRFDFTGLGRSGGDFADTTFTSNVADLVCATEYLRDTIGGPSMLIGHSLGGAAVLAAANLIPEAKAVVTIGAPADTAHVEHLLGSSRAEIEAHGVAEVVLAGRPFRISREFLTDIRQQNQQERIAGLRRALLVMHSQQDELVGVENARLIYDSARHPKSFVSLDGADHLLTDRADAAYVAEVLAAWVSRYLDIPHDAGGEPGVVTVAETGMGTFQQSVTLGRHQLIADEPRSFGGADTGLGPFDLLLAGLGACTSMTVRMYADSKQLPLEQVTVSLRMKGKDTILKDLVLSGDLTAEQREKLHEIADKCPVHRTLTGDLTIETATP
ncbi:bifunctional alpha/beta hydrolase/OsmC family protein [Streptomyces sp. NBC_01481]|uniref:bifunctional alpha/beta hydrolase/OsmC family protein n=1 Tax=Streptomyces sp. NBC_01481 TaxID=2975869 RepID=UPI00225550EC|nr:bifunctional alpha/beta hydrolase/OsmC family protein [Streptomyces sp. NBC_01481]MCX4585616.1 bifunctional alpha/beta hydrolase/OsmC family protein [Streptomyces sp. NBC_01481]